MMKIQEWNFFLSLNTHKSVKIVLSTLCSLIVSTSSPYTYSEIYQCKGPNGKTIFKDEACDTKEKLVGVHGDSIKEKLNTYSETIDKNIINNGKAGKLIFEDSSDLVTPYKIKVHEVRIVSETQAELEVDVIYTYEHDFPAADVKIFVYPNHSYWSLQEVKARKGKNVARFSIGLSESNWKKDFKTFSLTSTLDISFEHYPPDNTYGGSIWSELVEYKKSWHL